MANEIIYNPLLKRGLQELGDTAAQEAEIDDLRQHKVTKFFAATDTLEPGEIAQYQGDDDSINGLLNGFFYKKTSTPIVLPAGTQFFNNPATTVNLYGYNVTPGNFYLIEDITPEAGNTFFNYYIFQYNDKPNYLFFQEGFNNPAIGDKVWNRNNNTVVTVTNITYDEQFRTNVILSDGTTIIANSKSGHLVNSLLTFVDSILNYYSVVNCSEMNVWTFVHYSISGSTFNLIDWFCIEYCPLQPTLSPTTIGSNVFQQVNTQPDETVSDTVTEDDPNPVSGGAVFNAIKDAIPSEDKWEVVATLTNNSSSVVSLPFSVPKSGFYLIMIGGTNGGNNCMARLLTPSVSPFVNTLPIASVVMMDGYGAANLCYLFSGHTYNFQLTEVTETTTAKIIRLS